MCLLDCNRMLSTHVVAVTDWLNAVAGIAVADTHEGGIGDARIDWKGEHASAASAVTELPGNAGLLFGSLHGDGVAMVCFGEGCA